MKYTYTEWPEAVEIHHYNEAIQRMAQRMMNTGKVLAVYQVGGTNHPGISDIDLYVVFQNDVKYLSNPTSNLPGLDKYLFTHRLFGTSEMLAKSLDQFTLFGSFKLLSGKEISFTKINNIDSISTIKRQIALEYLIKAWIIIMIAITFKTIKLRSFLLHAKAILYDIEFLDINDGDLKKHIEFIIKIRDNWFSNPIETHELDMMIDIYEQELYQAILKSFEKFNFYLPGDANLQISKRITLNNSKVVKVIRKGLMLNKDLVSYSPKLAKLNNVLNSFYVNLPIISTNIPSILTERHKVITEAFQYNTVHLPGFMCTGHGLNVFQKQ